MEQADAGFTLGSAALVWSFSECLCKSCVFHSRCIFGNAEKTGSRQDGYSFWGQPGMVSIWPWFDPNPNSIPLPVTFYIGSKLLYASVIGANGAVNTSSSCLPLLPGDISWEQVSLLIFVPWILHQDVRCMKPHLPAVDVLLEMRRKATDGSLFGREKLWETLKIVHYQ